MTVWRLVQDAATGTWQAHRLLGSGADQYLDFAVIGFHSELAASLWIVEFYTEISRAEAKARAEALIEMQPNRPVDPAAVH